MPAEDTLYVFCPGAEGGTERNEWLRPRPIEAALTDRVAAATDTDADDVDDLESYADRDEVERLLKGDPSHDSLTFSVEGHDVTLNGDGTLEIDPD